MTVYCPNCGKIVMRDTKNFKDSNKYIQCPYCGHMFPNPKRFRNFRNG